MMGTSVMKEEDFVRTVSKIFLKALLIYLNFPFLNFSFLSGVNFNFSKERGILRGHMTPIFYLFIVEEDNRLFSISNDKTVKACVINKWACFLQYLVNSYII